MANRSFTIYHPNCKCTGAALRLSLVPAHGVVDGVVYFSLANQLTLGDRCNGVPATFDMDHAITIGLEFNDILQMVQVFRGECESINEGRGLYFKDGDRETRVMFRHIIEPICGYGLDIIERNGEDERKSHILISTSEALGICEALISSLYLIMFGVPSVS